MGSSPAAKDEEAPHVAARGFLVGEAFLKIDSRPVRPIATACCPADRRYQFDATANEETGAEEA